MWRVQSAGSTAVEIGAKEGKNYRDNVIAQTHSPERRYVKIIILHMDVVWVEGPELLTTSTGDMSGRQYRRMQYRAREGANVGYKRPGSSWSCRFSSPPAIGWDMHASRATVSSTTPAIGEASHPSTIPSLKTHKSLVSRPQDPERDGQERRRTNEVKITPCPRPLQLPAPALIRSKEQEHHREGQVDETQPKRRYHRGQTPSAPIHTRAGNMELTPSRWADAGGGVGARRYWIHALGGGGEDLEVEGFRKGVKGLFEKYELSRRAAKVGAKVDGLDSHAEVELILRVPSIGSIAITESIADVDRVEMEPVQGSGKQIVAPFIRGLGLGVP
ncbi:hypothetical protein R3P38DRAFT_2788050 [Favolaschia claudopus]|uniref:Uncharacterized protein n=1 Tax=Favolaschia claudopus TaxID=2862362 RepID=A0AAW0ALF9_9AGAR